MYSIYEGKLCCQKNIADRTEAIEKARELGMSLATSELPATFHVKEQDNGRIIWEDTIDIYWRGLQI